MRTFYPAHFFRRGKRTERGGKEGGREAGREAGRPEAEAHNGLF